MSDSYSAFAERHLFTLSRSKRHTDAMRLHTSSARAGTQPQRIIGRKTMMTSHTSDDGSAMFCQIRGDMELTVTSRHFQIFCWTPIKMIFEVACWIISALIDDLAFSRFIDGNRNFICSPADTDWIKNFSRIALRELFAFETFTKLFFSPRHHFTINRQPLDR